ncbi:MAG: hypothetical protein KAS04_02870 [Candidatus Aenigmarchaeota archaeon]|nr:hypothetical protein [Candidatus Aenigmarchaeota archaeon]
MVSRISVFEVIKSYLLENDLGSKDSRNMLYSNKNAYEMHLAIVLNILNENGVNSVDEQINAEFKKILENGF